MTLNHNEEYFSLNLDKLTKDKDTVSTTHLQGLDELRQEGLLSDVTIRCGDESFACHKIVLAASCPYLKAMFTTGMRESTNNEIQLKRIKSEIWRQILEFIYRRNILITKDNVLDLVGASSLLQIEELQQMCSEFLKSQIDCTNVTNIRTFAIAMFLDELKDFTTTFMMNNFERIIEEEEFLEINCEGVVEILKFDFLRVRSEYVPFFAAILWLQHNLSDRIKHGVTILENIRLLHFTNSAYIQRILDRLPQEINSAEDCERFLENISKRRSKRRLLGALSEDTLSYPRWFPEETIYVTGGRNQDSCLSSLEKFSSSNNSWEFLKGMQSQRTAVAMCAVNNHVYCVGGERENPNVRSETLYLSEVERYSPQFNRWTEAKPLLVSRSFGAVTVCRDKMYALGGENNRQCHNSVEVYDEVTNEWSMARPMTTTRSGVCATAVDSRVYVIGGHDNYNNYTQHNNSMEAMDPREGKWRYCMSLNIGRSGATAQTIDGKIYIAGGRNRQLSNFFGLCECYEPRIDRWFPVASMSTVRAWPGSAVLDKKLFVVGGYDCTDRLSTVEVFDPALNEWSRYGNMLMCRAGAAACAI